MRTFPKVLILTLFCIFFSLAACGEQAAKNQAPTGPPDKGRLTSSLHPVIPFGNESWWKNDRFLASCGLSGDEIEKVQTALTEIVAKSPADLKAREKTEWKLSKLLSERPVDRDAVMQLAQKKAAIDRQAYLVNLEKEIFLKNLLADQKIAALAKALIERAQTPPVPILEGIDGNKVNMDEKSEITPPAKTETQEPPQAEPAKTPEPATAETEDTKKPVAEDTTEEKAAESAN